MSKRTALSALILFLCTATPAINFTFNGMVRSYVIHVPKSYDQTRPTPLIFVLHGGGGQATRMENFTRFDEIAERENFIVLYPQGYKRQWNDGRNMESIPAQQLNIDDVGFIRTLVDYICMQYSIDTTRIYATGPSNGGFMTTRLGCELSTKFAAIAPIISTFPKDLVNQCSPARAVPVMLINGTADPLVPYNGGEVRVGKQTRGEVLSTEATIMYWVKNNNCSHTPVITPIEDRDKTDGCTATMETYRCSSGNADVILIRVDGGGHTLPGGKQYLSKRIIGNVCRDFIAEEYIWEFFKKHPKN
jgi:polyhydroxybutyrate depolymerase